MWSSTSYLSTEAEAEEQWAVLAIATDGQMVFIKSHFILPVGKDGNGTTPASLEDTVVDGTAPASLEDAAVFSYDTNHTLTK